MFNELAVLVIEAKKIPKKCPKDCLKFLKFID
jgi:hypothetical protein